MVSEKILVVEDESDIAEVMQVNLEAAGYTVVVARDGLAALRLFDSEHPDLITLDLGVPKISGFRLLSLFKRAESPGPVPVIVVTALSFEEGEEVAHAGADEFITKPVDPRELVARVAFTLAKRPGSRQAAGEQ